MEVGEWLSAYGTGLLVQGGLGGSEKVCPTLSLDDVTSGNPSLTKYL